MTKPDSLQRFIFENQPIRGELVNLQESLQTILYQHDYPDVIKKILGEALCVAALLSAVIKFDGRLTVQFRGQGKLKLLLAQCDNNNHMRGLAKFDNDLTENELKESFKDGVLAIILNGDKNKSQYQGVVQWQGDSLAQSIEGYFRDSEQLLTRIWLAVDHRSAAGFMLQVLPEEKHESGDQHAKKLMQSMLINEHDLLSKDHVSFLKLYFPEEDIRIFDLMSLSFKCTCSRASGEQAILVIGRDEAEQELQDKQSIVVTCDFCNTEYLFDRVDVATIFETHGKLPPNTHLH